MSSKGIECGLRGAGMSRIRALIPLFTLFACTAEPARPKAPAPDTASLAGRWRGGESGLTVTLDLRQQSDSVTGVGTFSVEPNSDPGCGAETLPAHGSVTFSGTVGGSDFHGRMSFADYWTPPYLGTRHGDSLVAQIMSVDRGGCPLVLVKLR